MVSALVVEDEPLARRRLLELLTQLPWVTTVGAAGDGATALALIAERRPEVVLLDVAMPEVDGLEVVRRLARTADPPAVIFTTAFEHHAVRAFECQALDYLLKPFGAERLRAALERARVLVDTRARLAALDRARAAFEAPACGPLERVFVREGSSVRAIRVVDIARISGEDDYAALHVGGRVHLVGLRLNELDERLPSPPFLRVHRSHIVNLDHVERFHRLDEARLEVLMKDGAEVPVSRARSREIRRRAR